MATKFSFNNYWYSTTYIYNTTPDYTERPRVPDQQLRGTFEPLPPDFGLRHRPLLTEYPVRKKCQFIY